MDIERVQRGSSATVVQTFYGGETALDADANVTYTIKYPDGTTYLAGTATHNGAAGSGQYKVTIPAQTNLNFFEVVWVGTFSGQQVTLSSFVEVVGGFYFSLSELRNFDSALANTTRFSTDALLEKRNYVEDEFEGICDSRGFVPRFYREEYIGDLSGDVYIRTEKPEVFTITKLTVAGVDQTSWATSKWITRDRDDPFVLNLAGPALALTQTSDAVVIEYEYGLRQVPRLIKWAGMKRARGLLLGANATIDERATVMSIPDFGTFNLATPGPEYTGIPDIDAVLHRFKLLGGAGAY